MINSYNSLTRLKAIIQDALQYKTDLTCPYHRLGSLKKGQIIGGINCVQYTVYLINHTQVDTQDDHYLYGLKPFI